MIPFNMPPFLGGELDNLQNVCSSHKLCGDGAFTKKCSELLVAQTGSDKVLLTTSCTHALEMAALLLDIQPGDEVIMSPYTFVSTANAFALRGAVIKFVDIRKDTMNLDEKLIESAITKKTKAIVPVHYAGVSCEMDTIMEIAKKHGIYVVEDAAQGVTSTYKGKVLGSIGTLGCYSFHETKNYSMGEGGAILINSEKLNENAEIIREKGTNRQKFLRGEIDKYTWVHIGSSYLPSELNAAYLFYQLENWKKIFDNRIASWNIYNEGLSDLANDGKIDVPFIPEGCGHNAHMYYIKAKDLEERSALISYLKEKGIQTVFHYVPLHTSPAGKKLGEMVGKDNFTTKESERLLRLPLYYNLSKEDANTVITEIHNFYKNK